MDWEIGTHGLRISFMHHNRRYGATYLPDVAREQGWTKEETLVSLMRKAGWNGKKDEWRKVELSVVRYQGKKVALEYGEWKEWRDWVDEEMADC
jgi:AMMECR1 domain-containing protein